MGRKINSFKVTKHWIIRLSACYVYYYYYHHYNYA